MTVLGFGVWVWVTKGGEPVPCLGATLAYWKVPLQGRSYTESRVPTRSPNVGLPAQEAT